MTDMRDCNNPEHALAYDRMRAVEQAWLQRWRDATGQPDAIAPYGVLLQWMSDQCDAMARRLIETEAVTAVPEPADALQRLRTIVAEPEPRMLTAAKADARLRATPRTC
jgi:hypothetical protein